MLCSLRIQAGAPTAICRRSRPAIFCRSSVSIFLVFADQRTRNRRTCLFDFDFFRNGKFAEAGYISVCDGDEVNIYDGRTAKITISEEAALKGWFCPHQRLWRIPLQQHITNYNTQTLILDGPTGMESLNSLYTVPSSPDL